MRLSSRPAPLLLLLLLLNGCSVYQARGEFAPPVAPAEVYQAPSGAAPLPERWWEAFGDEQLDALIDEALAANLDLTRAWARLAQAEALTGQAGSARQPRLGLNAQSSRSRVNVPAPGGADHDYTTRHQLGLGASYEVDLWGRLRSGERAARLDLAASRADLDSLAMTVAANVATTWLTLREQEAQLQLTLEQRRASATQLELIELRFARGLSSALDVYQQRQQLASAEADIPLIEARIATLENQLNILTGHAPGSALPEPAATLPDLWSRPAAGIPADLLINRPDVRSAHAGLAAADQRVAAAVADRLPSLSLDASLAYQADSLEDLLDQWVWNVAGSLAATLYDGHRKNLEVKRTRAVVDERLAAYGATLLTAVSEVEDALVTEDGQADYVTRLSARRDLAELTLDQARRQYAAGLTDYLTVLTALQSLQNNDRQLLSARADLLRQRITLCRALGGTWTDTLTSQRGEES